MVGSEERCMWNMIWRVIFSSEGREHYCAFFSAGVVEWGFLAVPDFLGVPAIGATAFFTAGTEDVMAAFLGATAEGEVI